MQYVDQTKSLFYMQNELIDAKVDISVNKSIKQVVEQIIGLRQDFHREINGVKQEINILRNETQKEISGLRSEFRNELHKEIAGLRGEMHEFKIDVCQRLTLVETALGKRNQVRGEIRNRFVDYSFRAGWILLMAFSGFVASIVLLARSFS